MKKNIYFYGILFLGIIGLGCTLNLNTQEKTNTSVYTWFDQMIGKTNSGVFKGVQYVEKYRVLNEKHHFFKGLNFVQGSIVFDGEPYYDLELKYNVFDDELLLKNLAKPLVPTVQLNKHKITNFTIDGHSFANINIDEKNIYLKEFLEVLFQNDSIVLYKKHLKKQLEKTDKKAVYYEFKDFTEYYVHYKKSIHKVKKLRNLNSIFPEYSEKLNQIHARHEATRKLNPDKYLISVVTDLHHILITEK